MIIWMVSFQPEFTTLNFTAETWITTCIDRADVFTCPDTKRAESFLKDTIDFSDSIENGDLVCYACYKFFQLDAQM